MTKAPAFQFYAKDHIATLALLSIEEAGVWVKLCAHLWEHGGPMPVSLAHRIVPEKAMLSICFLFAFSDERKSDETESAERTMWLPWMEKIRAEMAEKRALRVAAGKVGGRGNVRGPKAKSKAKANTKQSESKRKHSRAAEEVEVEDAVEEEVEDGSIEVEEKKARERKIHEPAIWPTFDDFWAAYEKKGNRQQAEAQWARIKQADREAIMDRLPDYIATKPEKVYRPDGQRFLKYRNWEDELIAPPTTAPKHQTNEQYAQNVAAAFARKYGVTDPA